MSIDKLDKCISDTLKAQEIEIPCIDKVLFEFEKNVEKKAKIAKQSKMKQLAVAAIILLCIGVPSIMNRFNENVGGHKDKPGTTTEKPSEGGSENHANPLSKYESIEEAEKATGSHIEEATWMIEGYKLSQIVVVNDGENGMLVRQIFVGDKGNINFEKISESLNIENDYNVYEEVESIDMEGKEAQILKREDGTYKAMWSAHGFKYSVIANPQISKDEVINIVEGLE